MFAGVKEGEEVPTAPLARQQRESRLFVPTHDVYDIWCYEWPVGDYPWDYTLYTQV